MRSFLKKITHPFFKKGAQWYYSKPRKYRYDAIEVLVHPEVFPPHLTISTKVLLDFMKPLELKDKSFLELGCGSGIVALYAAKKGALVTATDINRKALSYLEKAATKNNLAVSIRYSDLFEELIGSHFDFIFINPPYYPKTPTSTKQQAWFCGVNFEYFEKLFTQLPKYLNGGAVVYMILSEDCEIDHIQSIAIKNGLNWSVVLEKKVYMENNVIFQIKS